MRSCVDLGAEVGSFGRGRVSISERQLVHSVEMWVDLGAEFSRFMGSCVDLATGIMYRSQCGDRVNLERLWFYSMLEFGSDLGNLHRSGEL